MRHAKFLFLEHGPFASHLQFRIAEGGEFATESDRDVQLESDLPFLEVARGEVLVSAFKTGRTWRAESDRHPSHESDTVRRRRVAA